MAKILVVEDEKRMQNIIVEYMQKGGYTCITADDGVEALTILKSNNIDLMILDIMMPYLDGFSVCRVSREMTNIPIIILTAKGEEEDKLKGYEYGADDYITKPYSLKELELRIYARMRQYKNITSVPNVLKFSALVINVNSRKVTFDGESIDLTTMEFEILLFLAENKEQVFSKIEIYNQVWKMPDIGDQHTVQVHIAQMRKKINSLSREHQYIQTVWGKGYKFVP